MYLAACHSILASKGLFGSWHVVTQNGKGRLFEGNHVTSRTCFPPYPRLNVVDRQVVAFRLHREDR